MENFRKKTCNVTDQKTSNSLANISNLTTISSKLNEGKKGNTVLFKSPNKSHLQLNCRKKVKSSNGLIINDRYIPNRVSTNQMEVSSHLMLNRSATKNTNKKQTSLARDRSLSPSRTATENLTDNLKKRLIIDTCGGIQEKTKILSLRQKQVDSSDQFYPDCMKSYYNNSLNHNAKKVLSRTIQSTPERILDAPDFRDDYYLNLISWSKTNNLAVALNKDMYIWNSESGDISNVFGMDEEDQHYISSASWIDNFDNFLAVGNSKGCVEIWDVDRQTRIREMKSNVHLGRVACLSWNEHILSNGSRSGKIQHHDVRVQNHHVGSFYHHQQEVCGLKWSPDGRHLASGANDNLVTIWDYRVMGHEATPLHILREHNAAVKAVSWCPWQSNILATGGGTADGHIKIWNIYNGNMLQSQNADSQISCIIWSTQYKEIISSHGFQQHQLSIWKFPEMTKVCDLTGHQNRVLMMAMSPDEEMIVSAGADETLRLWKCFSVDKKAKEAFIMGQKKSSFNSLSSAIR